MAVTPVSFAATVTTGIKDGNSKHPVKPVGAGPHVSSAAVAADVATLVADGASPTQAHVNTLNADWALFLASYNRASQSNVTLTFDSTAITTMNQLKSALESILQQVAGVLTP